jgi:hypothetical protein
MRLKNSALSKKGRFGKVSHPVLIKSNRLNVKNKKIFPNDFCLSFQNRAIFHADAGVLVIKLIQLTPLS